jgi:hypothetical protein
MTPMGTLAAGLAAIAAVSVTSVAVISAVSAAAPAQHAPAGAHESGELIVCVGNDSVLRRAQGGGCAAGERRIALAGAEPHTHDCPDCDPWGRRDPAPPSDAEDPLAPFERRLAELERSPLFRVVDSAGNPVFTVAPGQITAYNKTGSAVAALHATDRGGYFDGRSADGLLQASIGAPGMQAGVRLLEAEQLRLDLGKQKAGNVALRVLASGIDGPIAGIGESRAGTGALIVSDQAGRTKTSLTLTDAKGTVGVFSGNGMPILSLTEGATAAGLLALGDSDGTPMVKMGVNDNRYGIVLAGPVLGFPLVPKSGLPGSYILGCAAGDGCGPQ